MGVRSSEVGEMLCLTAGLKGGLGDDLDLGRNSSLGICLVVGDGVEGCQGERLCRSCGLCYFFLLCERHGCVRCWLLCQGCLLCSRRVRQGRWLGIGGGIGKTGGSNCEFRLAAKQEAYGLKEIHLVRQRRPARVRLLGHRYILLLLCWHPILL